jgi:hypothetical protein
MEKKMMLMAITAAIVFIASSYMVTYAASVDDSRPGVEGLWNQGGQMCMSETPAAQSQERIESMYSSGQPAGVQGLSAEHRYGGVNLTQPEKGMDYLDEPGQPAGVQGLWPSNPALKCG